MKNKNAYDNFIDAVLSLPSDVRRDTLGIAQREAKDGNVYLYLFNRVQKQDLNDGVYLVMMEHNLLTNEMLCK